MTQRKRTGGAGISVVLDTGAILAGIDLAGDSRYYITPLAFAELINPNARLKAEIAASEGSLSISAPDPTWIEEVGKTTARLGESEALSPADVETLALALQLRSEDETLILATDDYAVQNTANALNIKFRPITEQGIKKQLTWTYICTGCRREYDKAQPHCEDCGNIVKRRVKRPPR
ncbi:hypothetical protein BMS3Abin16_01011 [archaeon BMS3Abin16]|nr:hypothetical protein BMS3Abin16_01011 [archaeon BMS3Abin16]